MKTFLLAFVFLLPVSSYGKVQCAKLFDSPTYSKAANRAWITLDKTLSVSLSHELEDVNHNYEVTLFVSPEFSGQIEPELKKLGSNFQFRMEFVASWTSGIGVRSYMFKDDTYELILTRTPYSLQGLMLKKQGFLFSKVLLKVYDSIFVPNLTN